ncbi:MAG: glycosyltransferase [Fibrobacter sp.]|jgi:glycosyltransferase involved in cell wall biosynthesis|nr:glycosyltransferase [Fibrobacter sp.]
MNQPKVSIIVPIYNVEKYLPRCMDSLLNQTLKDIEIIMVDDGSPDNCPAMCDEYAKQDNRIKVIHKKNGGLGFARNSGLEIATGKYIAFLDSDDFIDIRMYETLLNYAEENQLDTCYCRTQKYYPSGKVEQITELAENRVFEGRNEVDIFLMEMIGGKEYAFGVMKYAVSVWKSIYSMNLIKKNNILFISEKEMASEDLFFHIDYLSCASKVGWLNEKMHFYFFNTNSISKNYSKEKYNRIKLAMKNLKSYLEKYYSFDFYKDYYYGQLLRFQKVIFMHEISRVDVSYCSIRRILKEECRKPILSFLKNDYFTKHLSWRKKAYIFAVKYRLVDILFCLVKLKGS